MFTVEIGGRAIAVTNADESQARELIESEEFREDLTVILSDGKPVWDGKTEIGLRPATKDEEEEFESADDIEDEEEEEEGDGDEPSVVFLIDIDDEEDEDEDAAKS